jgi:flagellar motor switch protein FliG
MTTQLTHDGLRKAAILVASLDTAAADAVLDQLSPEQARQVREIVVELEDIDQGEQRRVIDEFFHNGPAAPSENDAGVELDGHLAWLASQADPHVEEEPIRSAVPAGKPFLFLQETETDKLVRALAHERPQTIALVISHLPPAKSGAVLGRLPESLQAEVVHRLVDLEETDPEILREVEEALRGRLSQHVQTQRRRVAGLQAVAGILQATDGRTGIRILDNLAKGDHTLAEKLLPRQLEFEDLADLDDDVLAETFDEAGLELMLLALFGASTELVSRVLSSLPSAEARALNQKLDHPGPIRLRDVEEARRQVARIASRVNYQVRS